MDQTGGLEGGDPAEPSQVAAPPPADLPRVLDIAEAGNLVLDVAFESPRSSSSLKPARKAPAKATTASRPPVSGAGAVAPKGGGRSRVGFRVDLAVLRRQSPYFDTLLGDTRFAEARTVASALAVLSLGGGGAGDNNKTKTKKATPPPAADLPWVRIVDDDAAATRQPAAVRKAAMADMLRVLHGRPAETTAPTMGFVVALAVLADRFDCGAGASKIMAPGWKLKWPVTQRRVPAAPGEDYPRMSRAVEDVLRQKILVAWVLNQPRQFQVATRELIMNGSCKWTAFPEQDDGEDGPAVEATWWNLQDGLEQELQYRRDCILNTVASIPRHFMGLFVSRTRQCQLGYDSSAACDSYQLGEMFKFLANKRLFFPVDFSPASLHGVDDTCLLPVDAVLATLRQCPGYQIDKHHTNCGLRTRMLPVLDFITTLLATNSVPLTRLPWRTDRQNVAWLPREAEASGEVHGSGKPFQFTRALASDQRLRYEHAMGADKFAKEVFTASSWNWSSED